MDDLFKRNHFVNQDEDTDFVKEEETEEPKEKEPDEDEEDELYSPSSEDFDSDGESF